MPVSRDYPIDYRVDPCIGREESPCSYSTMKQHSFQLAGNRDLLESWYQLSLQKCLSEAPLAGSPGVFSEYEWGFHFFYCGSIRGVAVVEIDEDLIGIGVGPFSSEDDIKRVTDLLSEAHSLGITIECEESSALTVTHAPIGGTLLNFLIPNLNRVISVPNDSSISPVESPNHQFERHLHEACWDNHSATDEGEESVGVEIVEQTYTQTIPREILDGSISAVATFLVGKVNEIMTLEIRVLREDYTSKYRPGIGGFLISDYCGHSCFIYAQCSHVYFPSLDSRYWGKLIPLQELLSLLEGRTIDLGNSIFVPAIPDDEIETWLPRLESVSIKLPPLI